MMKRFFLTVLITGLMAPAGLHAQKAYAENGKAVLDLTEAAGMPAGAVTATSKTSVYKTFNPNESALGANNDHNGSLNAKAYQKLEVSLVDPGTYNWVNAFNYCKNLTEASDSDWRLPTQRELMLIYIFKPALESIFTSLGGTAFSSAYYWSSTENNATGSWSVNFGNGTTHPGAKTFPYRVRCVREL